MSRDDRGAIAASTLGAGPSIPPRIRHITGIRVYRPTPPNSTSPASRTAPLTRHARSSSSATTHDLSYLPRRRHRAPTLAGEALEHSRSGIVDDGSGDGKVDQLDGETENFNGTRAGTRTWTGTSGEEEVNVEKVKEEQIKTINNLARSFVALISQSSPQPQPNSLPSSISPTSTSSASNDHLTHPTSSQSHSQTPLAHLPATIATPFFLSPIHRPSAYPHFSVEPLSDFASWLTTEEAASHRVTLEVWIECAQGREKQQDVGHSIIPRSREEDKGDAEGWKRCIRTELDLRKLRRSPPSTGGPGSLLGKEAVNTIEITLSTEPGLFYVPIKGNEEGPVGGAGGGDGPNGVVERSMRQTRMKRGIGIGALHQLINIQAVIADTERSIIQVQNQIDQLLQDDRVTVLGRDVSERLHRVEFVQQCVKEVEYSISDLEERIVKRREELDRRRTALEAVEEAEEAHRQAGLAISEEIRTVELKRLSLVPSICHWRSHHAQALDLIFPIQPLNPSTLLYSILGVPLPIPTDPKDTAPPLSSTDGSVNERTTAAALGYAALLLHVLGNLNLNGLGTAAGAGLPYPVTYAGSKSMPRRFPLYAKGVERYRYDYAVFLLNKDIHLLMLESNIRLIDHRHTLPNLKNLLLTLSSSQPPSFSTPSSPAWSQPRLYSKTWSRSNSITDTVSMSGSRQTSDAWTITPAPRTSEASPPRRGRTASPTPKRSGLSESLTLSMSVTETGDEEKESEVSYF